MRRWLLAGCAGAALALSAGVGAEESGERLYLSAYGHNTESVDERCSGSSAVPGATACSVTPEFDESGAGLQLGAEAGLRWVTIGARYTHQDDLQIGTVYLGRRLGPVRLELGAGRADGEIDNNLFAGGPCAGAASHTDKAGTFYSATLTWRGFFATYGKVLDEGQSATCSVPDGGGGFDTARSEWEYDRDVFMLGYRLSLYPWGF